ncbi:M3 family metallopeptidase [Glaciimonas sp. CA11.2]|uniref:M3 family metallopeptidase n=1 Tax=unclassified Glaciimonas TaxID=2644401 RepID=UPI002AB3ED84|nr:MULTISPECIES: M3 family metallopeptidase [unclassified Glaciimonas]MDY7544730.1 M3 family metallopeptidase [Glaciimonas sp. CA11.2]MEB0011972.1 M3 family metallopeptidase [Glaciimonas sp. Cout2]MEB0082792.1 M3 family metallopeptidase [Glaciimonas sp. Gout2]MEB0163378.1 M3 family metallopeptidase [Glaciimonas sp. CA11.2]
MKSSSFFWTASKTLSTLALAGMALNPAVAHPTAAPKSMQSPTLRPLIPLLEAEEITPVCTRTLTALRQRVSTIEQQPAAHANDTKSVLADWNALQITIEDLQGPVDILNNVSPDPKVRSATEACLIELNKFSTELLQNENQYARFKAIRPDDPVAQKLRQDILYSFEDAGVSLPSVKRARLKAILEKLETLSQEFARNIRDNTQKVTFTPAEMQGLPVAYMARVKPDDQGNYQLGFDYPDYKPFMESADNSDARRRYQMAFENHGTPANLDVLKQAMDLRHEMAGLFDLPSYADLVLRRRMAKSPQAVYAFLDEVKGAVTQLERKEIAELRAYKAETLKTPLAETTLSRWDLDYWQQKLKQARYNLDQEALRQYFPTDAAVPWILGVSSTLYGVEFIRTEVPVWDPEVHYYDVVDIKTKMRIAGIYLDLYPRAGKYGHAAAWGTRGVSTLVHRTPISVLVTNFDRHGLNSDELETLVHEFGHVLHGVLSRAKYVSQAGTNVELDFVEAPSQMYEEWARRKESLVLLSSYCKTPCPTVDDALVQRMTAAHNYGRGIRYARQLLYASYDMRIHNDQAATEKPLAIWQQMEGSTPLGYVPGTEFPGQFGHLMGGYAAGYYGYMWSEVLALDMLSRYNGKLMNPEVGQFYRHTILSRGGETSGNEMVRTFLGRAPNSKAFFAEISGQRLQ